MKEAIENTRSFYFKAQILFFMIAVASVYFLLFFSLITLFNRIFLTLLFMFIIYVAGRIYLDAKKNRESIDDFMLLYGLNKMRRKGKGDRH